MKTIFLVLAIAISTSFISVDGAESAAPTETETAGLDLTEHGEEGYNA